MKRTFLGIFLWCMAVLGTALFLGEAAAQETQANDPVETPARLSYTNGEVSFWRPGAPEWSRAVVNTPLSSGDELATGATGTLELQIGPRSFVRCWRGSQIGLLTQEPEFLQFKVAAGHVSFDLRALDPGETIEVGTPNAAVTIEHPGYYHVEIEGERTVVMARRGGRATVTPVTGGSLALMSSEELVIQGAESPQVASYAAPPLDEWDRWNYARTNTLLESVSARYVPYGTYGIDELDRYGTWRVVPNYGPIWIPTGMPAGWVPYSTGSWIMDPYYGWTWVSSLPWGWAPFHHGRWVYVDRYWAWAPGPVVARAVYAPALVAFLGTPSVGVGIAIGTSVVGWVALGWGEPCVPWWGSPRFAHRPWWGGWGGPRVVNNVVVSQTTVINVQNINVYQNTKLTNAVVAVQHDHFGRGPITRARISGGGFGNLRPLHADLPVKPTPASWNPSGIRGIRPSENVLHKPVVATRTPKTPSPSVASVVTHVPSPSSSPRIVTITRPEPSTPLKRPSFGQSARQRGMSDRAAPPRPPDQRSLQGPHQSSVQGKKPEQKGTRATSVGSPPSQPSQAAAQSVAAAREPEQKPAGPRAAAKPPGPDAKVSAPTPGMATPPARTGAPPATSSVSPSRPTAPPTVARPGAQGPIPGRPAAPPQSAQKRHGEKPPLLPGEPANKIAPYRAPGPSPKPGKSQADGNEQERKQARP
jgi:hypothetical protein